MNLLKLEAPTPRYSGRGETGLALAVIPLAFLNKMLNLTQGSTSQAGLAWQYALWPALWTALAFSCILWLASPPGERWLRTMLPRRLWLASLPSLVVGLYLLSVWLWDVKPLFPPIPAALQGQTALLALALLVAAVLLVGCFWLGLRLAHNLSATAASTGFGLRQLGCVVLAAAPYLVLQEVLPILWCFTTPVAVTVMVYGTGLGREYFNFSFVPRSWREAGFVLLLMGCGLLLFLLVSLAAGTISYTGGLWHAGWKTFYDAVFTWLFIVGISEEILFRCGVLMLIVAALSRPAAAGGSKLLARLRRRPRLAAILITSLLFALAHLFRGATLIFLAFLASLLYGLAFVAGKSLFGPVLLHGLLNVLVLMNFHLKDFK